MPAGQPWRVRIGGFALNVPTDAAILERTPIRSLFVQCAATDAGTSLGCALWGCHAVLGQKHRLTTGDSRFGGRYGASEIDAALAAHPRLRERPGSRRSPRRSSRRWPVCFARSSGAPAARCC